MVEGRFPRPAHQVGQRSLLLNQALQHGKEGMAGELGIQHHLGFGQQGQARFRPGAQAGEGVGGMGIEALLHLELAEALQGIARVAPFLVVVLGHEAGVVVVAADGAKGALQPLAIHQPAAQAGQLDGAGLHNAVARFKHRRWNLGWEQRTSQGSGATAAVPGALGPAQGRAVGWAEASP